MTSSPKRNPLPHLEGSKPAYDNSVWLRLPRPGSRCPVSGLSRSSLAELARPCARNNYCPPVDAKVLKRRGASRGLLLISRESLLAFLADLPSPMPGKSEKAILVPVVAHK